MHMTPITPLLGYYRKCNPRESLTFESYQNSQDAHTPAEDTPATYGFSKPLGVSRRPPDTTFWG